MLGKMRGVRLKVNLVSGGAMYKGWEPLLLVTGFTPSDNSYKNLLFLHMFLTIKITNYIR